MRGMEWSYFFEKVNNLSVWTKGGAGEEVSESFRTTPTLAQKLVCLMFLIQTLCCINHFLL